MFLSAYTPGGSVISMYHVTNVSVDKSPKPPDWNMIKPTVANDTAYNGNLLGLPVAFFTTTLFQRNLPNKSPYPRGAMTGTKHWRVTIPFNCHKFKLFLMGKHKTLNSGVTQIHLLCLNEEHSEAENVLTTILTHMEKLVDGPKLKEYFPNGKANEYTQVNRMFVNVSFINPVSITEDAEWDTVPKNNKRQGNISNPSFNTLYEWGLHKLKSLQHEYGMEKVQSLQLEWEALNKKGKLNQVTTINTA